MVETEEARPTELDNIESIRRFKEDLIKVIPYSPNTRESRDFLLKLGIGEVLHIHDFWRHRLIDVRPRRVESSGHVRAGRLYRLNREKIRSLTKLIVEGKDINNYLSRKAHFGCFDVERYRINGSFMSFRDQLLVCEGLQHLHLAPYPARTNAVVISNVLNSRFDIIGVFPHELLEEDCSVDVRDEYNASMSHYARTLAPPNSVFLGGVGGGHQNMAGSSVQSTMFHTHTYKIIRLVEMSHGGLKNFVQKLYHAENRNPQSVKPRWVLSGRSLEIHDKANGEEFRGDRLKVYIRSGQYFTPFNPDAFGNGFL